MAKVKLSELINAIECSLTEFGPVLNLKTGEVLTSDLMAIMNCEDFKDWNEEDLSEKDLRLIKAYKARPKDFLALPSQYDAHEYRMMENFAFTIDDQHQKEKLMIALHGKGAFRRFKDTVLFLDLAESWYQFKTEEYRKFILDWCRVENIEVLDE